MKQTIKSTEEYLEDHKRANLIYDRILDVLEGCDFEDAKLAIAKIRLNFMFLEDEYEEEDSGTTFSKSTFGHDKVRC